MPTLAPRRLADIELPLGTSWLLGACMEARGKQALWTRQRPEVLAALRQRAIVHSVESSNRIEGVTVPAHRLRPLVIARARPRDRSEEELAGYRRALAWIYSRRNPAPVSPPLLRKLHAFAQGGSAGDAGAWKRRDSDIVEVLPTGERRVRFSPTPARAVPAQVAALCANYQEAVDERRVPGVLLAATFVFDLLCVHPFRDGNGRVSRLVTTLLLLEHGFEVVRYVSLERLVEHTKDDYYRVLEECSRGWHEDANVIIPWWNYFLGLLREAYREFELHVEATAGRPAKSEGIRQAVSEQVGTFALGDVLAHCADASPQLVKKVLQAMKREGRVVLDGRGRGARWRNA